MQSFQDPSPFTRSADCDPGSEHHRCCPGVQDAPCDYGPLSVACGTSRAPEMYPPLRVKDVRYGALPTPLQDRGRESTHSLPIARGTSWASCCTERGYTM